MCLPLPSAPEGSRCLIDDDDDDDRRLREGKHL